MQSLQGTLFCKIGETDAGMRMLQNGVDECRKLGSPVNLALALLAQGSAYLSSNLNSARISLTEALQILRTNVPDAQAIIAEVMHNIGELERRGGCYESALDAYTLALESRLTENDRAGCAASLTGWGLACSASGKETEALIMLDAAEELRTLLGIPLLSPEREEVERARTQCAAATQTDSRKTHRSLGDLVRAFGHHAAA